MENQVMRYSKQRELIYHTVRENPIHPTADQVYHCLRKQYPTISLGTVYRNLNLLAEHGLLRKIHMPDSSDRFDGRLDGHYHMQCCQCGRIYDVELPKLDDLRHDIQATTGFQVSECDIVIKGTCKACQTNNNLHSNECQGGKNHGFERYQDIS